MAQHRLMRKKKKIAAKSILPWDKKVIKVKAVFTRRRWIFPLSLADFPNGFSWEVMAEWKVKNKNGRERD